MRVLVCGGRRYDDFEHVANVLNNLLVEHFIECVVTGAAPGADRLALRWCHQSGVPCVLVPALWDFHGKRAGPIRNKMMLAILQPDLVVAFPGGRGTADMVKQAKARAINVTEPPGEKP